MRPRTSRTLVVIAIVVAGLLVLTFACRTRVPEFRGVVLDARTGAPIAGAIVVREFYKPGPLDFVDTRAPRSIRNPRMEVTTDSQGRFSFPRFSALRITGMGWLVFKPGIMSASGCYREKGWAFGGCSGFGSFMRPDPWRKVTVTRDKKALTFEVHLFPPTTDGIEWPGGKEWTEYNPDTKKHDLVKHFPDDVDPWGEYFRRLNSLSEEGWLPVETFVQEAVGFLQGHELTESVLDQIYQVCTSLGYIADDGTRYKADQALILLQIEEKYCQTHPELKRCDPSGFARQRERLQN